MPVNPNSVTQAQTPTALVTATLQLQPNDKEARLLISGVALTAISGVLAGSLDNVTFFPIPCYRDSDGAGFGSSMILSSLTGSFPTSFWIDSSAWNYIRFVPSSMSGTSASIQIIAANTLGGSPAAAALYNQNAAMVLGMSIITDVDLAGILSAT